MAGGIYLVSTFSFDPATERHWSGSTWITVGEAERKELALPVDGAERCHTPGAR